MWFKIENQIVTLNIFAKPNAKKTALLKITDEELHIAIHAKPMDGEANIELIKFISKLFKTPKTHIIMPRGDSSRYKQVQLPLNAQIESVLKNPSILLLK